LRACNAPAPGNLMAGLPTSRLTAPFPRDRESGRPVFNVFSRPHRSHGPSSRRRRDRWYRDERANPALRVSVAPVPCPPHVRQIGQPPDHPAQLKGRIGKHRCLGRLAFWSRNPAPPGIEQGDIDPHRASARLHEGSDPPGVAHQSRPNQWIHEVTPQTRPLRDNAVRILTRMQKSVSTQVDLDICHFNLTTRSCLPSDMRILTRPERRS